MYPGSRDAGRRPSLNPLPYLDLMAATLGRTRADIAALVADLQAIDNTYAVVYVNGLGGNQLVANGGVCPFVPSEDAMSVQLPGGGPWRSAWVAPVVSGNWYNSYWASAIGNYADNGAASQLGVIGQCDILWVDNTGYTQSLEPRVNVVPIWPGTTEFKLEQSGNLSLSPPDPHLILPIPVWLTRRVASNDMSLQGY